MRFRSIASTALFLCIAGTAGAQGSISPNCPAGTVDAFGVPDRDRVTQDACQQAVDLFNYMRPQLGIAIAGGNATLGQGGALGGLPHFAIGVRANVLAGSVPVIQTPSTNGAVQRNPYETDDTPLGLPAVDASIGLFGGIPLGITSVGGVDLLLSASYIPTINTDNVSVEPETNLQIGYGVRVGLLQESLLVPGVGLTVLHRGLPKTTITGFVDSPNGGVDTVSVKDLDLQTTAWRLVASKSLVLFTLAAGVGQDRYTAGTTVNAVVHAPLPAGRQEMNPITINEKMTRTNMFADVSLNLLVLKIVGEIGQVSGGTVDTYNVFDTKADATRMYASVGIRIGF